MVQLTMRFNSANAGHIFQTSWYTAGPSHQLAHHVPATWAQVMGWADHHASMQGPCT